MNVRSSRAEARGLVVLMGFIPLLMGAASCDDKAGGSSVRFTSSSSPGAGPSPSSGSNASPGASASAPTPTPSQGLLAGYSVGQPDEIQHLPLILVEVSGVTALSALAVACVQDEEGSVFIYDVGKRAITNRIRFAGPGDYEGIARVGSALYVLRADGTLFEIANYAKEPRVQQLELGLPTKDNEGLCYDPQDTRLLIAPKSRLGKGAAAKESRALYAFDLETRRLVETRALSLDVSNVIDERQTELRAQKKSAKKGKGGKKQNGAERPVLRFMPSAVAVHPTTGNFFVLSATDRNLAVFDRKGQMLERQQLDVRLYPQPEGVTFLPNGELVITNEGGGGRGSLLRLRPRA